jgi:hypothetical protein
VNTAIVDRSIKYSPHLAGAEGFEPPNGGIKTRCLTTWRRPTTASDSPPEPIEER